MSDLPTGGCTWPEQDVIDAWLRKHRVVVTLQDGLELKDAVSRIRVDQVREATAAGCQAEQKMREQRDAAESRFVKTRSENDDLQEMVMRAEAQQRYAQQKVANLRDELWDMKAKAGTLGILALLAVGLLILSNYG